MIPDALNNVTAFNIKVKCFLNPGKIRVLNKIKTAAVVHSLTLRTAFILMWLLAPERSSWKRWSRVMSDTLSSRTNGRVSLPRDDFFSCSFTWGHRITERDTSFSVYYIIIQFVFVIFIKFCVWRKKNSSFFMIAK